MTATLVCGDLVRDGREVDERAARLAGGLAALGVEDGGTVAVMLRNDPAYVDIIQGCRIAGAFYCQINWHFKSDEAGYILADSGATLLFVHADLLPRIAAAIPLGVVVIRVREDAHVVAQYALDPHANAGVIDYDQWLAAQPPYAGPPRRPRGHMAYTSGTTGRPKGVRRVPADAAQQALAADLVREAFGIGDGDRCFTSGPLYHSAPSLFAQHAMLRGALLVLEPKFDAERTLALIERHRIEVAYLVPTMYVRLLRLPEAIRRRHDLSSLRFVASTGSPCPPEVKRAMIEWLGPVIYETYASSETGLITLMDPRDAERKPGSAGRPAGKAELRILDAAGAECANGEVGTIYVRQPAYPDFSYHNNPQARRAMERDGFVSVGDMGYLDDDGFLFVCDRASDMVISGGVNIYPAEIEHALLGMPGVLDCVVVGIPDDEFGEALAAHVCAAPGSALAPATVADWLRGRIAGYKVPRRIELVDALPRDDNGKVLRRRVRAPYWEGRTRQV